MAQVQALPGKLDHYVPDVPFITEPVRWDIDKDIDHNMRVVERWMGHYSDKLPAGAFIDEAAIMVPSNYYRKVVDAYLRAGGWEEFNAAKDMVHTNPFGTRYFVSYTFYRRSDKPWRIELMSGDMGRDDDQPGFSPLHQALWTPNGEPPIWAGQTTFPIPHLSFRAPAGDLLRPRTAFSAAVRHLQDNACIHVMSCQSTYGVFGYYLGNETPFQIYLKPRVNLRDAA